MGLDMYLNRFPRYPGGATVNDLQNAEEYLVWEEQPKKYKDDDLVRWCGVRQEDLPPRDVIDFCRRHYTIRYPAWDMEHKHGWKRISEPVGYWRNANAIHFWFVENVQDGEDDCDIHREVTKEDLEELRDLCIEVVTGCPLIVAKIQNGYSFLNGKEVPNMVDGLKVMNPEYAAERLPTKDGFFFGSTGYDQFYIDDLKETIDICNKVLCETDFETQMLHYRSSW